MKPIVGEGESEFDLIVLLAHELAVALELSYSPVELRELWSEALEGLEKTKDMLKTKGIKIPAAIEAVIKLSKD